MQAVRVSHIIKTNPDDAITGIDTLNFELKEWGIKYAIHHHFYRRAKWRFMGKFHWKRWHYSKLHRIRTKRTARWERKLYKLPFK